MIGATADWDLFLAWCTSLGLAELPTTADALHTFMDAMSGTPATERRRMSALRKGYRLSGTPFPIPAAPRSTTVRSGGGWAGIPGAIAALPTVGFPAGLRGRRDGWLLTLIGVLGLTRAEALSVSSADIMLFPELRVRGLPVAVAADPGECPRCAVTRWLRVIGPAARGWRSDVRDILEPTAADGGHDCTIGLDGSWRTAGALTPAIDRHGWVNTARPVSLVTASTVMRTRQERRAAEPEGPRFESTGRFRDASRAELADAYDEVNDQIDELLTRTAKVLGEGKQLRDRLADFGLTG